MLITSAGQEYRGRVTQLPAKGGDAAAGGSDREVLRSAIFSMSSGAIVTLTGTISFFAFSLVNRIVILRLITVSQWGIITLAMAAISLLSIVAPLGVTASIARNLLYVPEERRSGIVKYGLLITLGAAAAFSLLIYFIAPLVSSALHEPGIEPLIRIFAPTVFLTQVTSTISAIFQGYKKALPSALFNNTLPPILFTAIGALLYFTGMGFYGVVIGYLISTVIVAALSVIYAQRKSLFTFIGRDTSRESRFLVAFGLPLLIAGAFSYLFNYADTLLLGVFRDASAVGQYSAALSLGRIIFFGINAASFILLPVAAELFSRSQFRELRDSYTTATKWNLVLSVPLLFLFLFFPTDTLATAFGLKYVEAREMLQLLAVGNFIASVLGPAPILLTALGRTKLVALNGGVSAVGNVVASLILIPAYGGMGASAASVVGLLLYQGLALSEMYREGRLHPFRAEYAKPLAASLIVPGIILSLLHPTLQIAGIVVVFFILAIFSVFAVLGTGSVEQADVFLVEFAESLLKRRLTFVRRIGAFFVERPR